MNEKIQNYRIDISKNKLLKKKTQTINYINLRQVYSRKKIKHKVNYYITLIKKKDAFFFLSPPCFDIVWKLLIKITNFSP